MAAVGLLVLVMAALALRQNIIVILLAAAAYVHLVWGDGHLEYLAEDIWTYQGGEGLIANADWPQADDSYLVESTVTLPIQVNGKRRSEITVAKEAEKAEIETAVMADAAVQKALDGAAPKKLIVVPGRIVNVVI